MISPRSSGQVRKGGETRAQPGISLRSRAVTSRKVVASAAAAETARTSRSKGGAEWTSIGARPTPGRDAPVRRVEDAMTRRCRPRRALVVALLAAACSTPPPLPPLVADAGGADRVRLE